MLANNKSLYYIRLFTDLFLLSGGFLVAAVLAQSFEILINRNYMFILLAVLNFLWYFSSNVFGFYDEFHSRYFSYQFINILKMFLLQALAVISFIFVTKEDLFTRNFLLYYSFLLLSVISLRILLTRYIILNLRGREKKLKNLLIIGTKETGRNFFDLIKSRTDLGYRVIGMLGDEKKSEDFIIGSYSDLVSVLDDNEIELVVIALPYDKAEKIEEFINICNRKAVRVYIIPDYLRFVSKKYRVSMFGNVPLIAVRDEPLSEAHWRLLKRVTDIIISVIAIALVLSVMIPVVSIMNLFFSRGPLFFIQKRYGANDKIFNCYKFRTMYPSAGNEKNFKPAFKDDPRITKVGRFLRSSNLDEVPQFINVLKGEMSVVGPRPHAIPFNELYAETINELRIRHWVKPGITGWAQIHGLRGDVPDPEENRIRTRKRIEYDIWYIENWSFFLDIQIILITIWQMIRRESRGI